MRALAPALLVTLAAGFAATSAYAEDRDFCADRPGRGTPACTLSPGEVMLETGVVSLDHDADAQSATDTLTFADTLVRVGVDERTEVQIGLTGYAHARSRDRASAVAEASPKVSSITWQCCGRSCSMYGRWCFPASVSWRWSS